MEDSSSTSTDGTWPSAGRSADVSSLDAWLPGEVEEEDSCVCRICRMPGTSDNVLFHPCRCSGSIKYVHEPCLIRWLNHSGKAECEVCGHEFSFTPVYAEDAPSQLPMMVLLWGTVKKGLSAAVFLQRALMVWLSWLVILPVTTCFMWRIAFSPVNLANSVLQRRMNPMALLFDCIQGSLLTALLFILMMMLFYVKDHYDLWITHLEDYFDNQLQRLADPASASGAENSEDNSAEMNYHNRPHDGDSAAPNNVNGWDASSSEAWIARDSAYSANPSFLQNSFNAVDPSEGDDEPLFTEDNSVGGNDARLRSKDNMLSWSNLQDYFSACLTRWGGRMEERLNWLEEKLHDLLMQLEDFVRDRLRRWEENIQNHLDQLEERVEERMNQFDQPFERVLGLQGPLHNIFLNMSAVIVFCGIMIACCVWVPLRWGWVVAAVGNLAWKSVIGGGLGFLFSMVQGFPPSSWMFAYLREKFAKFGLASASHVIATEKPYCLIPTFEESVLENQCMALDSPSLPTHPLHQYSMKILSEIEAQMIPPNTSELALLLVGWLCFLVTIFVVLWMRSAWQVWARNGRHRIVETGVYFSQWLYQTIVGLFVVVKVITVLLLEVCIFPAGFGYWVHLCMLPIFKATAFKEATFVALLFHWLCGMGFLLGFTATVHVLREVLRPGSLPFLRDPTRPDREPFADMAFESFHKQIVCWLFSCVVYSVLGVLLLHIPAMLAKFVCTQVYPVKLLFAQVPASQLPIDLLLFHMFLPFTIGTFMRSAVRDNLHDWLIAVSSLVGLEEYLLTEEDYQQMAGARQQPLEGLWTFSLVNRRAPTLPEPFDGGGASSSQTLQGRNGTTPDEDIITENRGEALVTGNEWQPSENNTAIVQRDLAELEAQNGFGLRLGFLGIISALSLIACHMAMLVIPVVLGRGLCMGVFRIPTMPYDLFASYVGVLTLCAVLEATRGAVNLGAREDVQLAVHDRMNNVLSSMKVVIFATFWTGLTAFLAGLLVEIMQQPIKMMTSGDLVPINMLRVWGSGVILLLMWHVKVSRLQRANPNAQIMGDQWHQEIAVLHQEGLWAMDLNRAMRNLVLPVITYLLIALLCPWVGCKLIQYILRFPSSAQDTIELNAHLFCFVCWVLCKVYRRLKVAVLELETSIRDDQYLVRQELNNFVQTSIGEGEMVGE